MKGQGDFESWLHPKTKIPETPSRSKTVSWTLRKPLADTLKFQVRLHVWPTDRKRTLYPNITGSSIVAKECSIQILSTD